MAIRSTVEIGSKRFCGKSLSTEHMAQLTALYGIADVMAMLAGPAAPLPDDTIEAIIQRLRAHWDAHGFGPYVFHSREDQSFVGYAGLRHTISGGVPGIELLYAVHPSYWGKGVCTEIAHVTVAQGFEALLLKEVVSFTLLENAASKRVLEKLGFAHEGQGDYGGLPHAFYRLNRASFSGVSPS